MQHKSKLLTTSVSIKSTKWKQIFYFKMLTTMQILYSIINTFFLMHEAIFRYSIYLSMDAYFCCLHWMPTLAKICDKYDECI